MFGKVTIFIAVLGIFAGVEAGAQFIEETAPPFRLYLTEQSEPTAELEGAVYADQPLDTARETQNPTVALFKSMMVPGWGQIGNRQYIKAGIIIALEATLIAAIVHYAGETADAKEAFEAAEGLERELKFQRYLDAKDNRNRNSWFLGTVIFLSMFDAYVDAHLAGFPQVSEKVSIRLGTSEDFLLAARCEWRF